MNTGDDLQDELVRRAMDGDHQAFDSLVRPEIDRLYGLAGLLLSDRSRAEDAVQEALLRAWRDLPKLREIGKFLPWLRRLVVNASHDEGRRLGRRRGEVELGPQHERDAGDELAGMLDRDEIAQAFRRLKEEERTVIALRYYLDLSTADAAASMGIREVTYRSKLHRAIKMLGAAVAADARAAASPEGRWT
ncbi:MAG: RNA polymerase sigma factor [Candidatus Limnocylindria bacterium]